MASPPTETLRQRHLTNNSLAEEGKFLLYHNVKYLLKERDNIEVDVSTNKQVETLIHNKGNFQPEYLREFARANKLIAEELESDRRTQELINKVPEGAEEETITKVANAFINLGNITWSKILALFYFGYKLCRKSLTRMYQYIKIFGNVLASKIVDWIKTMGGWLSFTVKRKGFLGIESFSRLSLPLGVAIVGGALVGGVLVYKRYSS
ncbi:apoptosis regulator BAX-like [Physella acuta]|uniref:apoptosis regulator BAX-like n=1 Tax=Physella acuta TaxID=109671 RepID=UPI0027DC6B44|nr:apoptosis regulator BAX-like [Physella acuta]